MPISIDVNALKEADQAIDKVIPILVTTTFLEDLSHREEKHRQLQSAGVQLKFLFETLQLGTIEHKHEPLDTVTVVAVFQEVPVAV